MSLSWSSIRTVFFDFDSTLVSVEGLDVLASIVGGGRSVDEKKMLERNVRDLTDLAMAGKVPFDAALRQRMEWLRPRKDEVARAREVIARAIEPEAESELPALRRRGLELYIVSGGMRELIDPAARALGFPEDHVFCNDLRYEGDVAVGVDQDNPLAFDGGKVEVVRSLGRAEESMMVGDGSTDAETRTAGVVAAFIAYAGVTRRRTVIDVADGVVEGFAELGRRLREANG